MEEKSDLFESLLDTAAEYGETSFELYKLKVLDKATDIVSGSVPFTAFILLISTFFLFLNLGVALWLGELLGKMFYGFFAVSAFYLLFGLLIFLFLKKPIKRLVGNYFVRQMLK